MPVAVDFASVSVQLIALILSALLQHSLSKVVVRAIGFHYTSPFVVANQNPFANASLYSAAASLWTSGMYYY